MELLDALIVGGIIAILVFFAPLMRDAWNNAYYDEEGNPRGL